MKRKIIISVLAILLIFLGIEFLPGFRFMGGALEQTEKPFDQSSGTTSSPTTSTPVPQSKNNATKTASPSPTAPVSQDSANYQIKSASLLGLDTAVESSHFTVYCHKADEEKAKELVMVSEKDYPALVRLFPKTPRTDILITYDVNEYVNVFTAAPPWGAEAYKDPNSAAGAFCPGCTKSLGDNTEYVYMLRPGNTSFAHELAHRYYWASYPNLRTYTDVSWLNEGQAVYAQTEVAPGPGGLSSNLARINDSPLPDTFVTLKQLLEKGDSASTERFYDLVGLLAYYLDGKTSGGLYSFIADLNNTGDVNKTCQNKLGFTCDQVFAKWKDVVTKTSASDPSEFLAKYKMLVAS